MPLDAPFLRQARMVSGFDDGLPPRPPLRDRVARARELACEIETLLDGGDDADGFSMRFAKAMTRNLIDQLAEIDRPPSSGSRIRASSPA